MNLEVVCMAMIYLILFYIMALKDACNPNLDQEAQSFARDAETPLL